MTPEAEKVANQIHWVFFGDSAHSVEPCPDIAIVARIVHDAYQKGASEMRERAAELTTDHNGCIKKECFQRNCAVVLFDEIKALPLLESEGEAK